MKISKEKQRLYSKIVEEGFVNSKKVLNAFLEIKREDFAPYNDLKTVYQDSPLPIGYGQTISQPTTVLLMTQWLDLSPGLNILEVGTGSGYQAAIISKIIGPKGKLTTLEIVPKLFNQAKEKLKKFRNVYPILANAKYGWKKNAPYDRIIFTAAPKIPPIHLLKQLKKRGVLLVPVGEYGIQDMLSIDKNKNIKNLGHFSFVPLQ